MAFYNEKTAVIFRDKCFEFQPRGKYSVSEGKIWFSSNKLPDNAVLWSFKAKA